MLCKRAWVVIRKGGGEEQLYTPHNSYAHVQHVRTIRIPRQYSNKRWYLLFCKVSSCHFICGSLCVQWSFVWLQASPGNPMGSHTQYKVVGKSKSRPSLLSSRARALLWEWGPLHTRDWEPMTITLQALSLVEKAEPVQVHFTLRLRDQRSMWMQDGCKVHMDSYMASNGLCVTVTWTIFKNRLLEVGLTQNHWETMALWMLTTVGLLCFIMCKDPHE